MEFCRLVVSMKTTNMAEINSVDNGGGKRHRGGRRSKKLSTRVDLTPMVDLGFLLITFFIFTTSMSQPKTMKVILPANPRNGDSTTLAASGVLTLIPIAGDSLYYYEGKDPTKGNFITDKMIRDVIIRKKQTTSPDKFMVILKPSAQSTYKNIVNLLDEMLICEVKHYVMTDAVKAELLAMNGR